LHGGGEKGHFTNLSQDAPTGRWVNLQNRGKELAGVMQAAVCFDVVADQANMLGFLLLKGHNVLVGMIL
jgi:hypothetical protein